MKDEVIVNFADIKVGAHFKFPEGKSEYIKTGCNTFATLDWYTIAGFLWWDKQVVSMSED